MREPVNNQWLSPQLRQLAQEAPQPSRSRPALKVTASRPGKPTRRQARQRSTPGLRSRSARRGQPWQYLATLVLLLGSAAFSYVAWSEADSTRRLLPNVKTAPLIRDDGYRETHAPNPTGRADSSDQKAPIAPATVGTPAVVTAEGSTRKRVNALREQNRQLLHRLRELQATLETPAAD